MLEKLKEKFTNGKHKKFKFTKRTAALGTTAILVTIACLGVSSYEPGSILFHHQIVNDKKISIPELSKSSGPKQPVELTASQGYGQTYTNKKLTPDLGKNNLPLPNPAFASDDFFNKLPTSMPSFSTPPSLPTSNTTSQMNSNFDANMVYAHHVSITDNIKSSLSSAFTLTSLSDAPTDNSVHKFVTAYEINNDGNVSERFELMSIVRTNSMVGIKTATDALNNLVQEHDAVNILDSDDSYLIYSLAGSKGYQIGKISVDDQGIYILGYINLTTNDMPQTLVSNWVDLLKAM